MKQIQLDVYSLQAATLKDTVASVVLSQVTAEDDPIAHAAATYLQNWDSKIDITSIGATIWTSFFPIFFNDTFYDEYFLAGIPEGPYPEVTVLENFTITNYPRWFNNTLQSGTQTRDDIIKESFVKTVNALSSYLGSEPAQWQYSRVHIVWIQHIMSGAFPYLDAPRLPTNGSEYTVN